MSDQEFNDVWTDFTTKAKPYNSSQRADLLQSVKDSLAAALAKAGTPPVAKPELAPLDVQSPTASASAATPASGSTSTKDAKNESVTGSRPSTRVVANPGGTSSIVLGGVTGEERPSGPISAKKHLQNSNQSSFSLGGDDGPAQASMSGVKIHKKPGGGSSIVFGDDSNPAPLDPADKRGGKGSASSSATAAAQAALAGSSPATPTNDLGKSATVVKIVQAPGGKTSVMLGEETKDVGGSEEVPIALRREISTAVYRKGKLKDTFTKFTGNKSKTLNAADLKLGLSSLTVNVTDVQAAALVKEFAKDPEGLTYADFVRILAVQ